MLKRRVLKILSIILLFMWTAFITLSIVSKKESNEVTPPTSVDVEKHALYISPLKYMLISKTSLQNPYIEIPKKEDIKEDIDKTEDEVVDTETPTEEIKPVEPEYPREYCVWGDFTLTEYEFKLLCTTVYCEAGNQPLETQIMVCLTILNRYDAKWGSTLRSIIYAPNAYEVTEWSNFESRGWTPQVEEAVEIALKNNNHPRDMFYFRTDYFHKGEWAKNYMISGDLYFSVRN